jgi:HPt (histidine-containing phosphotransfer) domain-containing protein
MHLSRMKKAADQGDAASLENEAPAVKGAGVNLGVERFGELALDLETKAKSGFLEGAQEMLSELEAAFQRIQRFLDRG